MTSGNKGDTSRKSGVRSQKGASKGLQRGGLSAVYYQVRIDHKRRLTTDD